MKEISPVLLQTRIAFERDEAAYRELFLLYYKPLLNFTRSFLDGHEAAEEIVSDVLLKIWEMKEDLGKVENLKVYLYTAVRNRAINHLTRNKRHLSWDPENHEVRLTVVPGGNDPQTLLEGKELRTEIVSAVKALPPKCRMVYKLVRENGLSYKEVGSLMNISVKTVDRHLNTALHKIVAAVKTHFVN